MVTRTGGTRGLLEIDLRIKGFGRFRCSAQTMRTTALRRRKAIARLLGELGQFDVLRAVLDGELAWAQLEQAQRQQRLADASLAADLKIKRPLRAAIDETLPVMGPTALTRDRYRVALDALPKLGLDVESMTVADLKRDDWRELLAAWDASPATKNGIRTAVSRFLTRFLGDKHHPFRRAVLHEDRWPRLKVPRRVRGFDTVQFWPLMRLVPERLVPSYVVLAASGMRIGEYLHPDIRADEVHHVIETVGKTGPKTYSVDAGAWEYVRAGVPCRASRMSKPPTRLQNDPRYKALYRGLRAAGDQLGIRISPHDLRRLYVRLGVDAMGAVATQHAVGHETPAMTAEYARWQNQSAVAGAVAVGLGLSLGAAEGSGKKSGKVAANDGRRRAMKRHQR